MNNKLKLTAVAILATVLSINIQAQDPGVPDTLEIIGDTVFLNQSTPIDIKIVNDDELTSILLGLHLSSPDNGYIRLDSGVFINRMADPSVLDLRKLEYVSGSSNGLFPDTLKFGGLKVMQNLLPAGSEIVARMYFTGITAGTVIIDSNHVIPTEDFSFSAPIPGGHVTYEPQFTSKSLVVAEGIPDPIISTAGDKFVLVAGESFDLAYSAFSPIGSPVTTSIFKFSGYDESLTSLDNPLLTSSNFSWTPSGSDIGIWELVLESCDDDMHCSQKSIIIQVLESDDYLLGFEQKRKDFMTRPIALSLGDLDQDGPEEIILSNEPQHSGTSLSLWTYDNNSDEVVEVYTDYEPYTKHSGQAKYFNKDKWLDLVFYNNVVTNRHIDVLTNNQNYNFTTVSGTDDPIMLRGAIVDNFNSDKYLDYAGLDSYNLYLLKGASDLSFEEYGSITFQEKLMTVQSQDLDNDGDNDLAVGTLDGLYILKNNNGVFTQHDFYPQTFKAADIAITNKGCDFNNDNEYDLFVAAPSVGGDSSLIIVYRNDGSANFTVSYEKQIQGQAFGNVVADFNLDNNLDIAFINGTLKYISFLFGDGDGSFTNEYRVFLDVIPSLIATSDFDLDGDMDLVVTTSTYYLSNSMIVLINDVNPSSVAQVDFEAVSCDNSNVELISPSGKILNDVKNGLASFTSDIINVDDNDILDNIMKASAVETGLYELKVTPKPNLSTGELFNLEYQINEVAFRLAHSAPMSENGYTFNIAPDGSSLVTPIPGEYIREQQPLFSWPGGGEYDFRLAYDIKFENILLDTTISDGYFTLPQLLSSPDTTIFYWQVKPTTAPEYLTMNSFNLYEPIPTGVDDNLSVLPFKFNLAQNYPNPFNPTTEIEFSLPSSEFVVLKIYNMLGQEVKTLVSANYTAGKHRVSWDSRDNGNQKVASGLYMYQLTAGKLIAKKKMILLK